MPTTSMRRSVVIDQERYFVEKKVKIDHSLRFYHQMTQYVVMFSTSLSFVSSMADSSCWHKITISKLSSVLFA